MVAGDWYSTWDNAPLLTAAILLDSLAAMNFKTISPPHNSPVMVPADHFLFPRVKVELGDISRTQETFQKT
jgi:hypothetical protein